VAHAVNGAGSREHGWAANGKGVVLARQAAMLVGVSCHEARRTNRYALRRSAQSTTLPPYQPTSED